MAGTAKDGGEATQLAVVEKLVALSRADWKYADLYLRQAEAALIPICSRQDFEGLLRQRERIASLVSDLRHAVAQQDWAAAERLARTGEELRDRVERSAPLLAVAQAIYGRRTLDASTTTLALTGAVSQPARELERDVARLAADLRMLAEHDPANRPLYERRAAHLEHVAVDLPEHPPVRVDPAKMRETALRAAAGADFGTVLRMAQDAVRSGQDRLGRVRAPRPSSSRVEALAAPLPDEAVRRAARLGLEIVSVEAAATLGAYLSCACAECPTLPSSPLTPERREPEGCTCGHACPPQVEGRLRSSLDALMIHPFLTSGGTRYLPWFGDEVMLVETFREDEPDARTPLLEALSLPRRRALPRLAIEDALLTHGPPACEELGLDPVDYRMTCVPFDVYERIAGRFGWGVRPLWTHFDGYQVTRELHLQALVGGDSRFGGPDDLCGVQRDYDSEHITARFTVLRRDRFEAREPRWQT